MKTTKIIALLLLAVFAVSCDEDDPIVLAPIESETVNDLFAPQVGGQGPGGGTPISGPFTLFDFETGAQTTDPDAWDIGFRGTTIIVNGGVSQGSTDEPTRTGTAAGYWTTGGFAGVTDVDASQLAQDSANILAIPSGSDNGWYNYSGFGNPNPANDNLITPIAGRVLVFRTTEGRYAKVEVLSYYQGNPAMPNGFADTPRYYTFNYVYQPNDGVTTFE